MLKLKYSHPRVGAHSPSVNSVDLGAQYIHKNSSRIDIQEKLSQEVITGQ